MPANRQVLMGSLEFVFEGTAYFLICGYFYGISKQWQYVQIPTIGLAFIGTIILSFMPESPRFLVSQHKFDKARQALNFISKINGKGTRTADEFVFEEEFEVS